MIDRMLTVAEVADQVRLSEWTVREILRDGELVGSKIRGQWRVYPADLAAWVDDHRPSVADAISRDRPSATAPRPRPTLPSGGARELVRRQTGRAA